ncbi:hypothetical protein [Bifidobacterium pseudolongum]|uniref:hypothetical protein n=1 Tax=Bifidobacterium pseudolongum TaxID=1694 RepID=UPI001022861C|nr:hypothetical protein [Bifidobacterium pseudolongum]RYQ02848.1 hypothetical protein PG2115B_0082 [Bifidobacterium pseudolongum subsp. globosum]RYQ06309.1 hypothetical protein PG2114B_0082 [Bifidobacterium pseudolongum subsp. globosum]RYQ13103.1 hypothetical protein PG2089B_0076 [Bifidobacterium pseudolongum subsp. globosum]
MKFNEIIEEWTTSRTFAYLGAAAACAAAASAYKRAQAKGRSRLYVLLAVAWAALTVYDVWDSRQDDSEEDGDNVDDWGTASAV